MKRQKTPKLIITFPTTTAAMRMDDICSAEYGRLIPIPREISAGCGLAWCADVDMETDLLLLLSENNISYQEKRIIEMY